MILRLFRTWQNQSLDGIFAECCELLLLLSMGIMSGMLADIYWGLAQLMGSLGASSRNARFEAG